MDDQLSTRIQALPAELFNNILDFVFSPSASQLNPTIDETYTPPSELQISSTTRETFADRYYASAIFMLPKASRYPHFLDGTSILSAFFKSLTRHFAGQIRSLYLKNPNPLHADSIGMAKTQLLHERNTLCVDLWAQGLTHIVHPDTLIILRVMVLKVGVRDFAVKSTSEKVNEITLERWVE